MTRMTAALVACVAILAGCAEIDPTTREGMWQPTGANAANLRAQVAVPGDLVVGRAARASDGNAAARAVDRLRTGRVTPLPAVSISSLGGGGGTAAPAPDSQ